MQQALTRETKTLNVLSQTKASPKLKHNIILQEASLSPEANPEAVEVTKGTVTVRESMKEANLAIGMTGLNPKAGLNLRAEIRKVVSDVGKQTMSHKTVTSRKKPV